MTLHIVCIMSDANPALGKALSLAKRSGLVLGASRTGGGPFS